MITQNRVEEDSVWFSVRLAHIVKVVFFVFIITDAFKWIQLALRKLFFVCYNSVGY